MEIETVEQLIMTDGLVWCTVQGTDVRHATMYVPTRTMVGTVQQFVCGHVGTIVPGVFTERTFCKLCERYEIMLWLAE